MANYRFEKGQKDEEKSRKKIRRAAAILGTSNFYRIDQVRAKTYFTLNVYVASLLKRFIRHYDHFKRYAFSLEATRVTVC